MSTTIDKKQVKTIFAYDNEGLKNFVATIIQRNVFPDTWIWLNERKNAAIDSSAFNTAFAAMPRKTGKAIIKLSEEENTRLQSLRPGWSINNWFIDRLCRVWLLMNADPANQAIYFTSIDRLFLSAEMNELVALYSSLPILAYPEIWRKRCTEGIRSNIGDVLQAIICNNPYPAEQLDEKAWNQLVLKAFFTEKPIHEIVNLDERTNQELADILSDYAHERWAAGRPIHPLLWRCTGRFINDSIFHDIEKIASSDSEIEREAAALACHESNYGPAKKLLETMPAIKSAIEKGELTWQSIAQKINTR